MTKTPDRRCPVCASLHIPNHDEEGKCPTCRCNLVIRFTIPATLAPEDVATG